MPALLLLLLPACRVEIGAPDAPIAADDGDGAPTGEVWIYTSMYQSVIDAIDPQLRAMYPGLEPKWHQGGSEKIAQRLDAEWSSGGSPVCLVMTSDPFWYVELDAAGRLQPYLAPTVLQVDRSLVDPEGAWVASRLSLMVLAVHERMPEDQRPTRFAELSDPKWRDRVTTSDPLASGTMFTTLAFWAEDGWDRVEALKRNGVVAAGGNSAVLTRVETGEKDVGVILLENVLAARRKGSPVVPIFPEDGAIVVPGPIALTKDCPNPTAAKAVYDFVLSEAGQRAIVAGDMYAALPGLPAPEGAPGLDTIAVAPWEEGFAAEVVEGKAALKGRWAELVSQ